MIFSLAIIIAMILGVSPWIAFALLITWIPDMFLMILIFAWKAMKKIEMINKNSFWGY